MPSATQVSRSQPCITVAKREDLRSDVVRHAATRHAAAIAVDNGRTPNHSDSTADSLNPPLRPSDAERDFRNAQLAGLQTLDQTQ